MRSDEKYKSVILRLMQPVLDDLKPSEIRDYKTALQQLTEQDGASILEYKTVEEVGPEHSKKFRVVALINNNIVGEGEGRSIKAAEQMAAKNALVLFGVV